MRVPEDNKYAYVDNIQLEFITCVAILLVTGQTACDHPFRLSLYTGIISLHLRAALTQVCERAGEKALIIINSSLAVRHMSLTQPKRQRCSSCACAQGYTPHFSGQLLQHLMPSSLARSKQQLHKFLPVPSRVLLPPCKKPR